jgi:anti-anti-sigma factor
MTEGGVTVAKLEGQFDTANLGGAKEEIEARINEGALQLCLNLGGLEFINSSGIGYFVVVHKRLKAEGGELVLSEPSKFLQSTIRTLGLDRIFEIYESDAEALKHFAGQEAQTQEIDAPVDSRITGSQEMKFSIAGDADREAEARLLHIWKDGISFKYPDDPDRMRIDPDLLMFGCKVGVKFQQPFIDKDHVFEFEGEVAFALDQDDGSVKYHVRYTRISDSDRAMIEDYVQTKDLVLPHLPTDVEPT